MVEALRCPNCGGITFLLKGCSVGMMNNFIEKSSSVIYPPIHGLPPAPPEVPAKYVQDYNEACAVLPISPQCSAMLARRILQALLLDPAAGAVASLPKGDNLYKQIERATGIPSSIMDHLHLLREIGNFGAHEQIDTNTAVVLPVDQADATLALEVIAELFDHYFALPARRAAAKARWNQAKQIPAGKNPVQ